MAEDHPGFDLWDHTDPAFPIGDIDLKYGNEGGARAEADLVLPQTQPTVRTVAERYVGAAHSAQFWFALECTTDAQGNVECEAVLRGRHVHAFPDHGETDGGPLQEIRIAAQGLARAGGIENLAEHGQHCDLFAADWSVVQGKVHVVLLLLHYAEPVDGFYERRAAANREAERHPPGPIPPARPVEPTKPPVWPGTGGPVTVKPGRPGGLLAKAVGFFKRLAWGLFG